MKNLTKVINKDLIKLEIVQLMLKFSDSLDIPERIPQYIYEVKKVAVFASLADTTFGISCCIPI